MVHWYCVPGALVPLHWTRRSPVPGLDSKFSSVGGDRAGDEGKMENEIKELS